MNADRECGFCGRAEMAVRQVFCDDCHASHQVCARCVDEAAADPEAVYHLVA